MKIAVITGASSGMGKEFVLQLDRAEQFDEIWVIARRRERLEALASQVRAKLRPVALDLTDRGSIDAYRTLLEQEQPEVAVLVNGSGFGKFRYFPEEPLEDCYGMLDLNAGALMAMTHATLPFLRRGSRVYQICSLSSFQPVPYIGVYGATKAFVLSFSRALNAELAPRGIRVMAVCPGWVATEFFDRAVSDDSVTYYNRIYQPQDVVRTALRDMARGKDVSIHGLAVKVQVLAVKLLPHRLVMRIWMKQQKHSMK